MRVFIAIDIDKKVQKELVKLQQEISKKAAVRPGDVKWVKPEDTHFTLKFLGEIGDADATKICNIVKEVAARYKKFSIDVEGVGYFGEKSATVLWVGTGNGTKELCELQSDLEGKLDSAGWPKDARGFSGHLTLCRIKNFKAGIKLAGISKEFEKYKGGSISAEAIVVYQSKLTPQGPVYTVVAKHQLQ